MVIINEDTTILPQQNIVTRVYTGVYGMGWFASHITVGENW